MKILNVALLSTSILSINLAFADSFSSKRKNASYYGDIWRPTLSLIFPGTGQWLDGQYGYAAAYSGFYLINASWSIDRSKKVNEIESSPTFLSQNRDQRENFRTFSEAHRQRNLANQWLLFSGGLSAYHSFRSEVKIRQENGEYNFLNKHESTLDILKAPFEFSLLKRSSTYVPLLLIASLVALDASQVSTSYKTKPLTGSDLMYTSAISYNAGTYEEAMFRGWLMPVFMKNTHSLFWSNMAQSGLFAAAHLNQISRPYAQFGLGFYLGWLSQKSHWSLKEAIFIHSWWDVIALLGIYSKEKNVQLAPIMLPAWSIVF